MRYVYQYCKECMNPSEYENYDVEDIAANVEGPSAVFSSMAKVFDATVEYAFSCYEVLDLEWDDDLINFCEIESEWRLEDKGPCTEMRMWAWELPDLNIRFVVYKTPIR